MGDKDYGEVGARVVRGPDWKWGNQDGGEGHIGTVISFKENGRIAMVQWDAGEYANYRCSDMVGGYDLYILDSGPAGVKHEGINCDECKTKPIWGTRWVCGPCSKQGSQTYDLCSECYHGNKHDLDHPFIRLDFGRSGEQQKERIFLFRRSSFGIVPGSLVTRGRDWRYSNQDGFAGNHGVVTKYDEWPGGARNGVTVRWNSGSTNAYRVGANGNVDLKLKKPEEGPRYYKEHLAKLGEKRIPKNAVQRAGGSEDLGELLAQVLVLSALRNAMNNS